MHYYKRNIGDYAKKAGRLSMLEHGAYTLLIDACYDRERFPTRSEAIEWCWARTPEEIAAVDFVLARFFELEGLQYVQNRIKEEVQNYNENAKKNSRIATEREEKRRERARSVHEAWPLVHEAPPNHKPLTINHKKKEKEKVQKEKNTKPSEIECPDDVNESIWLDWLALRKAKKAPVTPTVVSHARRESVKSGLSLEDFLKIWCARGSQGLDASWINPHERPGSKLKSRADVANFMFRNLNEGPDERPDIIDITTK